MFLKSEPIYAARLEFNVMSRAAQRGTLIAAISILSAKFLRSKVI